MRFALLFAAILSIGCAPRARLTFPQHPLETRGEWQWFDVNHNGRGDFAIARDAIAYDDDEDGTLDRIFHLHDFRNEDVPHLILLLDSLPFELVAEHYRAGEFPWFDPPQKIIAPFPTMTKIAYTQLLHAAPTGGMIDRYYDFSRGRRFDGLANRIFGAEEPYETLLDYHAKFYESGLAYLKPKPWYAAEMARVRNVLNENPRRVTTVYITSASAMMSRYGRAGADEILAVTRQLCLQLLYERQGALKISVMADHGHNLTRSRNIDLAPTLRDAGFPVTDRLREKNDVVLELDGLVTYASVITTQPKRVADALLTRKEIEFAMYMQDDRVIVRDALGSAAIESTDGKVRYVPIDRDVLNYSRFSGFLSDQDWFATTVDHEYPDAPRRIWDAFHGEARNTPTVMLTIKDGWCAGEKGFEKFITMASTHGGLNQINTATFVMTMTGRIDSPMRTKDLLAKLEPSCK
jgi:hypothetical protein